MIELEIWTDGACRIRTDKVGAWAYVIIEQDIILNHNYLAQKGTTSNEMEITAAIRGLSALVGESYDKVNLYSDSKYLIDGITKWVDGWIDRDWKTRNGKNVVHRELWEDLIKLDTIIKPNFQWIRGHSNYKWNNYAHKLAETALIDYDKRQEFNHG